MTDFRLTEAQIEVLRSWESLSVDDEFAQLSASAWTPDVATTRSATKALSQRAPAKQYDP